MQKVPGVSAVRVSLNEGLTVIDLKPENTVTLAGLRQVIRNNGFVTREAQVTARGTVIGEAAQLTFEVSGSKERMTLSPLQAVPVPYEELRNRVKGSQRIELVLTGTADLRDPKRLRLSVKSSSMP